MKKERVTIDETIAILNELLNLDRPAMAALLANRVPCNQALADHPTVQADAQHGGFHVGLLGVINGLFGIHDENHYGPICYEFENGTLIRFRRTMQDKP